MKKIIVLSFILIFTACSSSPSPQQSRPVNNKPVSFNQRPIGSTTVKPAINGQKYQSEAFNFQVPEGVELSETLATEAEQSVIAKEIEMSTFISSCINLQNEEKLVEIFNSKFTEENVKTIIKNCFTGDVLSNELRETENGEYLIINSKNPLNEPSTAVIGKKYGAKNLLLLEIRSTDPTQIDAVLKSLN